MGGGGKGGGGGDSTTTVRYADYIEEKHQAFLDYVAARRSALMDDSPFANFSSIAIDDGFFGTGYILSSFPSLYDMYGKFMAGLDVDVLYQQVYGNLMDGPETTALVSAEATLLADELEQHILPRFEIGMRDINAVVSSTFVMGKALLESDRLKQVEKFSAQLKLSLLPVASERWRTHLEWNKGVIITYAEMMKLYVSAKMDTEDHNMELQAKDKLWPFTLSEYERAAIAALQGATTTSAKVQGASGAQRVIAGALSGAAMGGMLAGASQGAIGGPTGIIVGGLLGLAGSLF